MDLSFSEGERRFREDVRVFLRAEISQDIRTKVWEERPLAREEIAAAQRILNRAGYAVPHWPVEWGGRDWSAVKRTILLEEIERNCVPKPQPFNVALVGPVIAAFGTLEQKRRFLPAIANLDLWFCQGFSEPNAGSDLASLKTSAVRDGDVYRVNGQKTWTSFAHEADWIFCLVRTDSSGRKQQGITFLLIDLKSPGITIRPIETIDGVHHVNEVFFDDVVVPVENRIGEEGRGWDYAKYLLGQERTSMGNLGVSKRRMDRVRDIAAKARSGTGALIGDHDFRMRLARAEVELKTLEILQMRVVAGAPTDARTADPRTSILKIIGSEMLGTVAELMLDAIGPEAIGAGFADGSARRNDHEGLDALSGIASTYFTTRKYAIFGGSNEIQRSIIAKSVLGL